MGAIVHSPLTKGQTMKKYQISYTIAHEDRSEFGRLENRSECVLAYDHDDAISFFRRVCAGRNWDLADIIECYLAL